MRSPFIKNIEPGVKKEKILFNKRAATFLCCIFISVLFWLLMALSKEYTITVPYPVNYINSPADKVIANNLPQNISIELKSKGFFLMAYKFKDPKTVYVDLNRTRSTGVQNHFYLLTNAQINSLTDQLSSRVKIQRIVPDTIFLNFNKKITKRVPVRANLTLTMDSRYQQSDSIELIPAFVDVSGAADVIEKIKYVETRPLSINNIDKTQSVLLDIVIDSIKKEFDVSTSQVKAVINVMKFTEATIELPVEAINLPPGFTLKAFPDKVQVRYNVAFDNYEKINSSQFRAVIDYKKAEPNSNKLKITLEKFPADIRSVKLNPEKVEYILKK